MEPIFKKPFLAIEAVLYLACKASPDPVCSRELAEYIGLPVRYLETLMQKLVRANILRSVRGPKGGYLLAKERRNIYLEEILTVIDGGSANSADTEISPLRKSIIIPIMYGLVGDMKDTLTKMNIQHLCDETKPEYKNAIKNHKPDFSI